MIAKAKNLKKGRSLQNIIWSAIFIVLFLVISGVLAVSNYRIHKKRAAFESQIENLKAEIQEAERKRDQLKAGISEGESETFLEEQAREKLGLKKPGEEVVTVLPQAENNQEKPQENKGLWQRILEKLGF